MLLSLWLGWQPNVISPEKGSRCGCGLVARLSLVTCLPVTWEPKGHITCLSHQIDRPRTSEPQLTDEYGRPHPVLAVNTGPTQLQHITNRPSDSSPQAHPQNRYAVIPGVPLHTAHAAMLILKVTLTIDTGFGSLACLATPHSQSAVSF